MNRIADDLGVTRAELVRALLSIPAAIALVVGVWFACLMFVATFG